MCFICILHYVCINGRGTILRKNGLIISKLGYTLSASRYLPGLPIFEPGSFEAHIHKMIERFKWNFSALIKNLNVSK